MLLTFEWISVFRKKTQYIHNNHRNIMETYEEIKNKYYSESLINIAENP